MALSQDEQRILAEIEQRLASDDPGLASSLTAFRRPGPAKMLRSPRVRIVGSLFTVLLVAMVSLTVYAMIPFRALQSRPTPPASAGLSASTTAISVPASKQQPTTAHQSSASHRTGATASGASSGSAASAGQSSAGQSSAGQSSAGQSSTRHGGSSQLASSTAAASKSQPAKTGAVNELFPTANAKP